MHGYGFDERFKFQRNPNLTENERLSFLFVDKESDTSSTGVVSSTTIQWPTSWSNTER